jgi:DNA-binding HxlR family transcriptional regulator
MLTYTLRRLEKDGLVVRRAVAGTSPHVEYRLTPLGGSLLVPMRALCRWAQSHRKDVTAARKRQPKR